MVTGTPAQKIGLEASFTDSQRHRTELFLQLARENESIMLRVALRLSGWNRDLAEECVQEAIVSAYRAFVAERFCDVTNFRPWILRILTNAYLKECRRSRHIVPIPDFASWSDSLPAQTEFNSNLALSPKFERAIAMLSPGQRLCVTLVDIDECEYSEAAKILGVPIGTVRSRLARARLKMAELLATCEREELESA